MNEFAEPVWRQALKAKGKDWVRAELRKRPGHPQDPVYDIVFEEPFPTRDFCQQWCAEEENKLFHMSWSTYLVLAALIITVFCCIAAMRSISSYQAPSSRAASAGVATPRVIRSGSPTINQANPTGANSTGGSENRLPGICAYQTYETDECKPQN